MHCASAFSELQKLSVFQSSPHTNERSILFRLHQEASAATCKDMDEPEGGDTKENYPDMEIKIMHCFTHAKILNI